MRENEEKNPEDPQGKRLDRMESDIDVLKGDVKELKVGQERLEHEVQGIRKDQEKHFKLLFDTLNEFRVEDQRHIEMLSEKHKSDLATQGEGFKSNREQLDDHEVRIQRLEAS